MLRNLEPVPPENPAAPSRGTHLPRGPAKPPRGKTWSTRFAAAVRWLHIYVSLLAFTALVFFGVTGITLNHPTWFGADSQQMIEAQGEMNPQWLESASLAAPEPSTAEADPNAEPPEPLLLGKLEIVDYLRATHKIRGAVSEFRADDRECLVLFKGPAYAADAVIDRETGKYQVVITAMGMVALINDLHKGRDSGFAWSIVIDVVSLMTVFASVTGLILIFYIKRKRTAGLITTLVGTILLFAVAYWLVP